MACGGIVETGSSVTAAATTETPREESGVRGASSPRDSRSCLQGLSVLVNEYCRIARPGRRSEEKYSLMHDT